MIMIMIIIIIIIIMIIIIIIIFILQGFTIQILDLIFTVALRFN